MNLFVIKLIQTLCMRVASSKHYKINIKIKGVTLSAFITDRTIEDP